MCSAPVGANATRKGPACTPDPFSFLASPRGLLAPLSLRPPRCAFHAALAIQPQHPYWGVRGLHPRRSPLLRDKIQGRPPCLPVRRCAAHPCGSPLRATRCGPARNLRCPKKSLQIRYRSCRSSSWDNSKAKAPEYRRASNDLRFWNLLCQACGIGRWRDLEVPRKHLAATTIGRQRLGRALEVKVAAH